MASTQRGLLALGAELGGPDHVDPEEVQVAYRDIILREEYRWPVVPGGLRLPDASADVTIRVHENEYLYDKLVELRSFSKWITMSSENPDLRWRMRAPSGMMQSVERTRAVVEAWKQNLFSRAQGGDRPVLRLRHTDVRFLSRLQWGRPRRVRDAGAGPPTRRP
jgi:hypothetical protein